MTAKRKPSLAAQIASLQELRNQIDALEKQATDVRSMLIDTLGIGAHSIADFAVTITERTRTSLDTPALKAHFGAEAVEQFEKVSSYIAVTVR
jgi:hypothetical protein